MTPRERALMALNHREPDRVPIDLGGTIVTTVTRTAYDALRAHVGLEPDDALRISHRQMDTVYPRDDLGAQRGLFISPRMYREFVKPRHQKLYDFIRSRTRAQIFMHSCGSIYDVIPDLIDVGVDILNPLQRSAAKMDIAQLKREFGEDLSFWGGAIDVQQVLPFASLREIEDEVNRTLDIMAPGGGYVFCPSHNIQANVSPDRIETLYQTVLNYGG